MQPALPFVPYIKAAVPWSDWGPQQPVYPRGLPPPPRQGYFLPRAYARKAGTDVYDIGWTPTRFLSNDYGGENTDYSAYTTSGMADFTSGFTAPRGYLYFAHNNIWYQPKDWLHYGIKGVQDYRGSANRNMPFTQLPSLPGSPPFNFPQPFPGAEFGRPGFGTSMPPWGDTLDL